MALGDVTQTVSGQSCMVEILASATATNGAPSGASAGVEINALNAYGAVPTTARFGCVSTAGSGTMTVALRLWGYMGGKWAVLKALNGGSNIAETGTDTIGYSEEVTTIHVCSRLYLEITAIAGTSTAVTGYAWIAR